MEDEAGITSPGNEENELSSRSVSPGERGKSEAPTSKESKIFEMAINELNEVDGGGKRISYANRKYTEEIGKALYGVTRVTVNSGPKEVGYPQTQQAHDQMKWQLSSSLNEISETLDRSVVPRNRRDEIEDLVKKALTTQDPLKARKITEEAIDSFGRVVGGVARITDNLQRQRRRVKSRSGQNEEESRTLVYRFPSDLTKNYRHASRRLSEAAYVSDPRITNIENEEVDKNRGRYSRFKNVLSEIVPRSEDSSTQDSNESTSENEISS
ncbi:MAG: hypothetical protein PVJ52_03120 [Candidatus Woesebacteria bacterium]|jgi:hypothetical protein